MRDLFQFLTELSKERRWFGIVLLFICSAILTWGKITFSNPSFALPQPELGLALATIAAALALTSLFAVRMKMARRHPGIGTVETDDQIRTLVRIRINSLGEGLTFWKFEGTGEARGWLDVVNFAPFPVEIERIVGEVTVRGVAVASLQNMTRVTVDACAYRIVYVTTELSEEQLRKISFQLSSTDRGEMTPAGFRGTVVVEALGRRIDLYSDPVTGNVVYRNFCAAETVCNGRATKD